MKKQKIALYAAKVTASSASGWIRHQPKEPQDIQIWLKENKKG